jgi:hypothetical protein
MVMKNNNKTKNLCYRTDLLFSLAPSRQNNYRHRYRRFFIVTRNRQYVHIEISGEFQSDVCAAV